MSYTISPNLILNDSSIDANAYRVWMSIAQYDNLDGWRHLTKVIAKKLNLCLKTVLQKIKVLVSKNYLLRTPKNNGEFGYIYSIPDELKFFDRKEKKPPRKNLPSVKITVENFTCNNNKEQSNTEQEINTQSNQEIDFFDEFSESNCDKEKKDESITNSSSVEDIDQEQESEQETEEPSKDKFSAPDFKNQEFINFAKDKLPDAKNLIAYLRSPDKTTKRMIGLKIWRQFLLKGTDVETIWRNKSYDEMDFELLPEYEQWLKSALDTRLEWKFVENDRLGHTRNTRVMFYRWVYNYYLTKSN